ncbi:hypothetical protein [Streptomyces sp. PU-14G]|uniref:hypothetical protein n=1 Tax=Streptomyces sp. PU-14G TaxID=2800808 RepID=UPI0034DE812A
MKCCRRLAARGEAGVWDEAGVCGVWDEAGVWDEPVWDELRLVLRQKLRSAK